MYKVQEQEDGTYVVVDKDGAVVGDTFYSLRREALAEAKALNEGSDKEEKGEEDEEVKKKS